MHSSNSTDDLISHQSQESQAVISSPENKYISTESIVSSKPEYELKVDMRRIMHGSNEMIADNLQESHV